MTAFNPLTIWIYDECYIRFSALDYDSSQISNKFIHLTNNSIGAYYKDFEKSEIRGNMFFQQQFSSYLNETYSRDIFEEVAQSPYRKSDPRYSRSSNSPSSAQPKLSKTEKTPSNSSDTTSWSTTTSKSGSSKSTPLPLWITLLYLPLHSARHCQTRQRSSARFSQSHHRLPCRA